MRKLLLLLAVLLAGYASAVGHGPNEMPWPGTGPIHQATYYMQNAAATDEYCMSISDASGAQVCTSVAGSTAEPVYEPNYAAVTIHRLRCFYEDGTNLVSGDRLNMCVAYRIDATVTDVAMCADWVHVDNTGNSTNTVYNTTPTVIAANTFGLLLRVKDVTDSGSQFRGTCVIEYSGSN